MYLIIPFTIFANILTIVGLSIGLFYNFTQPKNKAIFGYSFVGCMIVYLVLLMLVVIRRWVSNPDLWCVVLTLCIISPFIIGKLVKYETLKKYTCIQTIVFIVGLITLFFK